MPHHHLTSGVEEIPSGELSLTVSSPALAGTGQSRSQTLPSSYDRGAETGNRTEGISRGEPQEEKASLGAPTKKALKGFLDRTLLKRAQNIIDGFDYVDPLDVTVNMESLRGIVLELWESAVASSRHHQDILAATESALLSIETPNKDQLSVCREAIRDLRNEVLTEEHVAMIRQQFVAKGFSPLALLNEVEDGSSTDKS